MKKNLIMVLLGIVLTVLTACGFSNEKDQGEGKSADSSKEKKVLNLSLENDIPDLNQVITTDGISFSILNNVMEGLFRINKDNEPEPAIAEKVEVSNDKLTYEFTLRKDVKWSNGENLTAHDFKYSWLRAMHPETSGAYSDILGDYIVGGDAFINGEGSEEEVKINVKDDYTLIVQINEPTPFFLGLTAFPTYFPLNQKFVEDKGENFALTFDNILYNGPFILTEYDQAIGVKMVKNDLYWDKNNVSLDEVNMKVIKETSTALNLYEAGDLDRVYLASADVANYKSNEDFGTETEFTTWFIQFNLTKPPFDNDKIRKAFQLSYDPSILTTQILNNGSEPASGLIATSMEGVKGQSFREIAGDIVKPDIEKAKKLFEEGLLEYGGVLPKIEILTADDTIAKDTATFLQSEIKKNLGIDIGITTKPYSGRLDTMRADDYQFVISRWGADYNDASTYLDLWVGDPAKPFRGNYRNEQYNKNIELSHNEKDIQKRIEYLIEAERILLEDDSVLGPLYYEGKAFLQNPKIKDLIIHPSGASPELKYVKFIE